MRRPIHPLAHSSASGRLHGFGPNTYYIVKRGSSGCVRPMVNCGAEPKQEEKSEEAENEKQKGGKQYVIARR